MTKDIKIIKCTIYPRITNIELEKEKTFDQLQNLYSRFKSENNVNNFEIILNKFNYNSKTSQNKVFILVDKSYKCWSGRLIALIDIKNPFDMKYKHGGFLVHDDGHSITLLNNNKCFKYNKNNYIVFMMLNNKDLMYATLHKFLDS